jgi:hypothetical protein
MVAKPIVILGTRLFSHLFHLPQSAERREVKYFLSVLCVLCGEQYVQGNLGNLVRHVCLSSPGSTRHDNPER